MTPGSIEARAFVREVRHDEIATRVLALRAWIECDLNHARDWKLMGVSIGIDTSADVRRNVAYAREWHRILRSYLRARKIN